MARSREQTDAMLRKKIIEKKKTPEGAAYRKHLAYELKRERRISKKGYEVDKRTAEARRINEETKSNAGTVAMAKEDQKRHLNRGEKRNEAMKNKYGHPYKYWESAPIVPPLVKGDTEEERQANERAAIDKWKENAKKLEEEAPRHHEKDAEDRKKESEEKRRETNEKKKDETYGKHEPDKAAMIARMLRQGNVDKGFYGHTHPHHFKRTSIIGTTGRVR